MSSTKILSLEKWVEFENNIPQQSGFNANIYNINGIRLTDNNNWANRLCPVIKANEKGISFICAVANMNMGYQAKTTGKPVIEECDAGLIKIAVPIFVGDEFIGTVGACGLLLDEGEVDSFAINKITAIDENMIESLSNDIKRISQEKAEATADYIWKQVNEVVRNYVNKQHSVSLTA